MRTRHVTPIFVVLAVLCLMASCVTTQSTGSSSTSSAKVESAESVLRVGVSARYKPLIYKDGGKVTGLEVDFANELGKYMGKSVQFVQLGRKDLIPKLLDQKIDIIMSGMSITKYREVQIAFSKPYFRTGQMALVSSANKSIYPSNYYAILGFSPLLKIGVVKATTGENFVRRNFGSAKEIKSFASPQKAVDALLVGNVNMVVHDAPSILVLAAENQARGVSPMTEMLTEEYLAWGIRRGDTELLETANKFIDQIKTDGSIVDMVKRWIPYDN